MSFAWFAAATAIVTPVTAVIEEAEAARLFCFFALLRVGRESATEKSGDTELAKSSNSCQQEQQQRMQEQEAGEKLLLQQLAATFGVSSAHRRSEEISLLETSLKVSNWPADAFRRFLDLCSSILVC